MPTEELEDQLESLKNQMHQELQTLRQTYISQGQALMETIQSQRQQRINQYKNIIDGLFPNN